MANVMNLFIAVVNYKHMFREYTQHMALFLTFFFALMPAVILPTDIRGVEQLKIARDLQGMTPAEFFRNVKDCPEMLPNFYPEAAKDLEDLADFYHLTARREAKELTGVQTALSATITAD